jgi:hypothetical protein
MGILEVWLNVFGIISWTWAFWETEVEFYDLTYVFVEMVYQMNLCLQDFKLKKYKNDSNWSIKCK